MKISNFCLIDDAGDTLQLRSGRRSVSVGMEEREKDREREDRGKRDGGTDEREGETSKYLMFFF